MLFCPFSLTLTFSLSIPGSVLSCGQVCLSFVNVIIEFSNASSTHKSMAFFSLLAYPCHMWSFIFLISPLLLSPIYKNASCSPTAVHHLVSLAIRRSRVLIHQRFQKQNHSSPPALIVPSILTRGSINFAFAIFPPPPELTLSKVQSFYLHF